MVNDPSNADLIRWSEAGDSFFVLDHERFAHEVLGKWFKHRNFSSFVRQLNMYGFHKIPHLQQGVLKSDTDTEFWNFAHANFHRGQPDLLCLIQRKKQLPQPGEDGSIDLRDPTVNAGLLGGTAAGPNAATGIGAAHPNPQLSSGQVLDINSIVNGITAIKRHQTTISAELNELKRSNQLLWQDALAARAKHQKQQDTINRIVKFLAGVFGHQATGGASGVAAASPGVPVNSHVKDDGLGDGTKRRMRLMIEDAKRDGPTKSMVEELTEMPLDADESMYETSYPTIETPGSAFSPSDNISITDTSPYYTKPSYPVPSLQQPQPPKPPPHQQQQEQGKELSRSVTPTRHSPSSFEFDPRIHGVLNQLSPSQIQQLLASLASQTIQDPIQQGSSSIPTTTINPSATVNTGGLLTPYHQPYDFSNNPASQNPFNVATPIPLVSTEGLIPFDNSGPDSPTTTLSHQKPEQQKHEERMEGQWQAAEDIDKDVNALNSSISSLIQTFGLDPALLEESMSGHTHDSMQNVEGDSSADFDFDSFFNNLSTASSSSVPDSINANGMATEPQVSLHPNVGGTGVNYSGPPSSTFFDEAPTPSTSDLTTSPAQSLRQVSPELNTSAADGLMTTSTGGGSPPARTSGRKRKSDVVMDFNSINTPPDGIQASTKGGAGKSKRRKDK